MLNKILKSYTTFVSFNFSFQIRAIVLVNEKNLYASYVTPYSKYNYVNKSDMYV